MKKQGNVIPLRVHIFLISDSKGTAVDEMMEKEFKRLNELRKTM
jgi:hypothetical protein